MDQNYPCLCAFESLLLLLLVIICIYIVNMIVCATIRGRLFRRTHEDGHHLHIRLALQIYRDIELLAHSTLQCNRV